TADAGMPLYITPPDDTWESASQCVAACNEVVTRSSLALNMSEPGGNASPTALIEWTGFSRPSTNPICGPSASSGIARENRLPVLISAAPARTTSAVIRLRVPISSSSPQRPQLRTSARSSSMSAGQGTSGLGDLQHAPGELAVVEVVGGAL